MGKIVFTKMVASGNDFVLLDPDYRLPITDYRLLAKDLCKRKYGIGADGLLVLEKSKKADILMRIFNADGSEAEMCGNGARCVAYYFSRTPNPEPRTPIRIETKAGIIAAKVIGDKVSIKLSDPQGIKLNIPLTVFGRQLRVNFINTGVPHTVIFVEGLEKIDVAALGRRIRYHKFFAPAGTNVDFVEVVDNHTIKIRTYERGVEGETLACGTGSVAAALITSYQSLDFARDGSRDGERVEPLPVTSYSKTSCHTQSGETLKVYFQKELKHFSNVWLEGKAQVVFTGTIKSKGGRR